MLVGLLVVVVIVAGATFAATRESSPPPEPLATLEVATNPVELRAEGGAYAEVTAATEVAPGSAIRTGEGALASVEYFDGSLTRVGPNTEYEVVELEDEPDRSVIVGRLEVGETFHDVKELTGSGSRFEIQESNAIAAVRGTRFAARCLPPLPCGIAVVEGSVEVRPSTGPAVTVGAGQRVTIDDAGQLGEVSPTSPDDPWLNRNRDLG